MPLGDARSAANMQPLRVGGQVLNRPGLIFQTNVSVLHCHLHIGVSSQLAGLRKRRTVFQKLCDVGVSACGVEVGHADPTGPVGGSGRVCRGGGWSFTAEFCRSAIRNWSLPSDRNYFYGFRVSLSPSGK